MGGSIPFYNYNIQGTPCRLQIGCRTGRKAKSGGYQERTPHWREGGVRRLRTTINHCLVWHGMIVNSFIVRAYICQQRLHLVVSCRSVSWERSGAEASSPHSEFHSLSWKPRSPRACGGTGKQRLLVKHHEARSHTHPLWLPPHDQPRTPATRYRRVPSLLAFAQASHALHARTLEPLPLFVCRSFQCLSRIQSNFPSNSIFSRSARPRSSRRRPS